MLGARANAWKLGVTWGDARTPAGDAIAWGVPAATAAECEHRLDGALQRRHAGLRSRGTLDAGRPAHEHSVVEAFGRFGEIVERIVTARRTTETCWPVASGRRLRSTRMKTLADAARVYVGGVIGLGAALLVFYFPLQSFSQPGRLWLFVLLLFLSAITSIFKVNLPLTRSGSTMSVSYAVDFASLLLLGPNETMLVAAASAYSQCTFRIKERNPLHRTLFSMACLVITVQAAGAAYHLLGGVPGPVSMRDAAQAARRRRDDLLRRQHAGHRDRHRAVDEPGDPQGLERELPLERAELLRRRRRGRPRDLDGHRLVGALDHAARRGAALPDLPHLQGLSRTHRGRAAPRARDGGPAPGDDRSAGAGHRRQGSDVAVAHPPRAALRRVRRAGARHVGQRRPGRQDGGAAARHRQARRARAHPLEAGAADAGGVPEDSRASARSAPTSSARCRSRIRSRRSSSAITSAGTARAIRPA